MLKSEFITSMKFMETLLSSLDQEGDAERRKLCEGYADNIANLKAQRRNAVAKADSIYDQRDRLNALFHQQETSIVDASQKYFGDLLVAGISLANPVGALSSGTLSLFNPTSNIPEKSLGAVGVSTAAGTIAGTFSPSVAFSTASGFAVAGAFAIKYYADVGPTINSHLHQAGISEDYTNRAADVMNGELQGIHQAEMIYQKLYDQNNCEDFE